MLGLDDVIVDADEEMSAKPLEARMTNTTQKMSELEVALLDAVRAIQVAGREVTQDITPREKQMAVARCLCAVDLALTRACRAGQSRTIERTLASCADDDLLAGLLLRRSRVDRENGRTSHH